MTTLNDAIDHLDAGDWEAAHKIVQNDSTANGSWAHGIVHIMEGDLRNAGYWYRRAGRALPDADVDVAAEIAALKAACR
ncbi:MAG: hypothetical protein OXG82_06455 [Gammaproteobacteria bacterium]|nr:hypothetical protein [Gammaproteobacteria bacterium]